jgi:hypothetical protein
MRDSMHHAIFRRPPTKRTSYWTYSRSETNTGLLLAITDDREQFGSQPLAQENPAGRAEAHHDKIKLLLHVVTFEQHPAAGVLLATRNYFPPFWILLYCGLFLSLVPVEC